MRNQRLTILGLKLTVGAILALSLATILLLVGGLSGCGAAKAPVTATPDGGPQAAVEAFYNWYINYPGNPLVDDAHRDSPHLTGDLLQRVDQVRASFTHGAYDPILCAQDIPNRIDVKAVSITGEVATVAVETDLGGHALTLTLKRIDGAWRIDDTGCLALETDEPAAPMPTPLAATPADTVRAFYEGYLGAINAGRDAGEMHNPLVEGAYRTSPHLSAAFIQELDALLAGPEPLAADPLLCAQDVPTSIRIPQAAITPEQASVTVETSFPNHAFTVQVVQVDGVWQINDVICAAEEMAAAPPTVAAPEVTQAVSSESAEPTEGTQADAPADWQIFRDEAYGFQLCYPADWTWQEIKLDPDGPPQGSLVRLVTFLPQAWADEMDPSAPPGPSQPPVVAPLGLDVSLGSMEAYRQLYMAPTYSAQVQLGQHTAVLEEYATGEIREIRYMFQHPSNGDLRVTLRDQISGFPMRVEGNQAVIDTANQILETFEFVE